MAFSAPCDVTDEEAFKNAIELQKKHLVQSIF